MNVLMPPFGIMLSKGMYGWFSILVCVLLTYIHYLAGIIYAFIITMHNRYADQYEQYQIKKSGYDIWLEERPPAIDASNWYDQPHYTEEGIIKIPVYNFSSLNEFKERMTAYSQLSKDRKQDIFIVTNNNDFRSNDLEEINLESICNLLKY